MHMDTELPLQAPEASALWVRARSLEGRPSSCQWAGGASWRKKQGEPLEPGARAGGDPPVVVSAEP